jgi:hypothetical protein
VPISLNWWNLPLIKEWNIIYLKTLICGTFSTSYFPSILIFSLDYFFQRMCAIINNIWDGCDINYEGKKLQIETYNVIPCGVQGGLIQYVFARFLASFPMLII